MLRVGLTGGIGSGKSTIAALFAGHGAPVIDADSIARRLLDPGQAGYRETLEAFGEGILGPGRQIDRDRLRKQVFDNADDRKRLESILHPRVHRKISERLEKLNAPYCIIVIPLLFEAGHEDLIDRVLLADADEDTQVQRVAARDGLGEEEIKKIIVSQMKRDDRRRRADDIITNNAGMESLASEVERLHGYYLALAEKTP